MAAKFVLSEGSVLFESRGGGRQRRRGFTQPTTGKTIGGGADVPSGLVAAGAAHPPLSFTIPSQSSHFHLCAAVQTTTPTPDTTTTSHYAARPSLEPPMMALLPPPHRPCPILSPLPSLCKLKRSAVETDTAGDAARPRRRAAQLLCCRARKRALAPGPSPLLLPPGPFCLFAFPSL